ncbi:MAG: cupin domain-containing protein [Christensenellales bacterium]
MEPSLVEIKAGCSTDSDNPHEGEEFGFVLEGKIRLFIGNKSYELKKGDSFYFKSEKVHFLKNVGAKTAKILWVSSPPNF